MNDDQGKGPPAGSILSSLLTRNEGSISLHLIPNW